MSRNTVRRALTAAAVAVLLPLAAACGVEHGTVIGKEYIAAHTDWTPVPITRAQCSEVGHESICRTFTVGYRNVPEYHPACWELHLRDKHGDTGEVCTSRSTYDKTTVGDQR